MSTKPTIMDGYQMHIIKDYVMPTGIEAPLHKAEDIIWTPDMYSLEDVAEAALTVLEKPGAASFDAHQATYLLITFRPR